MKNCNFKTRNIMKKLMLVLAVIVAIFSLSSCSDKTADSSDILKTIPKDASAVVVVNLESLLEQTGLKVEDGNISASKPLLDKISEIKDAKLRRVLEEFSKGEFGIDPSVAVFYQVGYYGYLTGFLSNTDNFRNRIEKHLDVDFSDEDGMYVAQNIAVVSNRFWVCLNQNSIDSKEVKHFLSLDASESFLKNKNSESLAEVSSDFQGWASISGLMRGAELDFQQSATAQVALQTIFEDPSSIAISADVEKDEVKVEATVLNEKGKLAKYRFPVQKIDLKTIESIGGDATALVAVSAPNQMIKQLIEDTSSKSPSVFGVYLQALSNVDGTIALAIGENEAVKGVVTTDGSQTSELSNMLQLSGVDTAKDGDKLLINKGEVAGSHKVADMASMLEGASLGFVSGAKFGDITEGDGLGAITLSREGNGLVLRGTYKLTNTSKNLVMSLLEM